jgi:hypothetical protein
MIQSIFLLEGFVFVFRKLYAIYRYRQSWLTVTK